MANSMFNVSYCCNLKKKKGKPLLEWSVKIQSPKIFCYIFMYVITQDAAQAALWMGLNVSAFL